MVREGSPNVTIQTLPSYRAALPDTPYALWASGELDDFLHLPEGSRAEIIGGEIVVSPTPTVAHGNMIHRVSSAIDRARFADPAFPWTARQVMTLNLAGFEQGYVPDLIVAEDGVFETAGDADEVELRPDEIELVVEVTSRNQAVYDRPPVKDATPRRRTKWWGYALVGIPYYLLIDRDPKIASTTLYSIPDHGSRAYLHQESLEFGATVHLPEPFDIEISTAGWRPWRT
ncbi:Uma2 family endonuclease [Actinomadura decatromicini]|uniref:Uma2 family endonuclease n=1 Tax=Actinomadura decatromicini TaxID=2604572 RepID=A0A5D3FLZ0_9ACTN|nr:Uma2 family endonuclease [Actinomadura decatromicini]